MSNVETARVISLELTLPEVIYVLRVRKGWDQAQLADATGLSRKTIGNYENGRTVPTRGGFKLLAMALEVPEELLVRPKGFEPPTFWSVVDLGLAA